MGRNITADIRHLEDNLYTFSTQEFAEKLGVSTQTIRARYRREGRLIGRQVRYTWLLVETEYAASFESDPSEYTISRTDVAARTGFHRDVVSRKLKGIRKGRETFFREQDVRMLEQKARGLEWVSEEQITQMMGAEHPVQVYYLRWVLRYSGGGDRYFARYRPDARCFPQRDRRSRHGRHLWRRKTVERYARYFRANPSAVLADDGLREYNAAPHAGGSSDYRMRLLWRFFLRYNHDVASSTWSEEEDAALDDADVELLTAEVTD